ncbi:hypothetical protein [Dietzia sp. 179-F 9C3 NHS]|uniref:hypothetical protein n=1 Tax=Dietzia sp. 179-F 9C3 NHS TaxID=3374295 RepID=UPI0038794E96
MPKFNFVLQLDDDEKDQLQEACDTKVFSAAVKAHESRVKDGVKELSALLRSQVTQDQLESAQQELPRLREMVTALSESDERETALAALERADSTLSDIQRAVAAAHPNADS